MGENISVERISMKDVFATFQMNNEKISVGQLYDELEWNLVDLPKRDSKMSMGFFRGKTIVPVWQNRLKKFPLTALTSSKNVNDSIGYNITFSSYENYFLYPPYHLFDHNNDTYARTSPRVYNSIGTYTSGGRSEYFVNNEQIIIYGEWVQLEMDIYNTVVKFSLTPTRGRPGEAPSKLYFLGFDVNDTWNLLLYEEFNNAYVDDLPIVFYVNKLIPCCKYRLVCSETSYKSSMECTSFSLSDMTLFGVTRYDKVPSVKLIWENKKSHTLTSDINDFDDLSDNLVSRKVTKVETSPNCVCVLYVGPNYTGNSFEVKGGSSLNINSIYSSLKVSNKSDLDLKFPFNWDGLEYAILLNSVVTFNGNAEVVIDASRGNVCKFAFGEFNLRIPKIHMRVVFSIMFWIKRGDGDVDKIIESSELTVKVVANNLVFTHVGSVTSLVDVLANVENNWTHYCISYDNTVFKLYRNGVLHAFMNTIHDGKYIDTDIFFGKGWNINKSVLLDNVRVYNIAIHPAVLKHVFDFEYFNANY